MGGTSFMHARIQLFMDETNLAYQNSQINLRARLVRRMEVDYPGEGDGNGSTQLRHLTNPDGVIDEVLSDRNNYRADQVVLLVGSMDLCGIAWCGNGNDPYLAFNVTRSIASSMFSRTKLGTIRAVGTIGLREAVVSAPMRSDGDLLALMATSIARSCHTDRG